MKNFTVIVIALFLICSNSAAQVTIAAVSPTDVCSTSVQFVIVNPQPNFTYEWYYVQNDCNFWTPQVVGPIPDINIGPLPSSQVYCVETDTNGIQTTSNYVPVRILPDMTMSGFSIQLHPPYYLNSICNANTPVTLCISTDYFQSFQTTISWYRNDTIISGATAGTYTATLPGEYKYSITSWCMTAFSDSVRITEPIIPPMPGSTSMCQGSSLVLTASAGPYNYLWSTGETTQTITVSNAGPYTVTVFDTYGCTLQATSVVTVNQNPVPVITGDSTLCPGQTAVLNAGAMYTSYLWNTSAFSQTTTVNATGTYTVTVTDANGCTGTDSIQVTGPQAFVSGNATICQGMSATITVAFTGNAPFTYSYHNGTQTFGPFTTNQNPTTINVTPGATACYSLLNFSDNSCPGTVTGMACITVDPVPQATLSGNFTMCQGDTTDIVASFSGPAPYAYSYSDGTNQYGPFATVSNPEIIPVSPSVTTTYTLNYFSNANCFGNVSGSATITINPSPAPVITGDSTLCPGQSTILNPGGPYVSYLWSNNTTTQTITATMLGVYTVTVTGPNGCTGSDFITLIAAPPYATVLSASGPVDICQGDSVQLSLQSPMNSYQWYKNNIAIAGATNSTLWVSAAGNYKCASIDSVGCDAISNQKRVSIICFPPQPAQERVQPENYGFEIFPNPTHDNFTIRFDYAVEEPVTVNIFEVSGKKIQTSFISSNNSLVSINSFTAGYYLVELLLPGEMKLYNRLVVY